MFYDFLYLPQLAPFLRPGDANFISQSQHESIASEGGFSRCAVRGLRERRYYKHVARRDRFGFFLGKTNVRYPTR
jgi:hypothetical protein